MKTRIRTEEMRHDRNQQQMPVHNSRGEVSAIAICAPEHVIEWESRDTIASIRVSGKDSDIVADAIRRYLLHKFPLQPTAKP